MQDYYDEQEIDLLDLLYKVLIHFKKILLVGLIFGLIFGGYKYTQTNKEDKIAKALVENRAEALETYANDISIQDVMSVLTYKSNIENYNKKVDYLENSLVLDNNFIEYKALLKVIGNNKDVKNYIELVVINDELIDDYCKKYNIDSKSEYYSDEYLIGELISVEINDSLENDLESNTIIVTVKADSKEKAEYLGKSIVEKTIDNKQFIHDTIDADVSLISEKTTFKNNDLKTKETLQTEITTLASTIEKTKLNDIQSRYYSYISDLEYSKLASLKSAIKYAIIGFIVGAFIVCAYYGMGYMLNGKIHTVDDLKYLNIKVLGHISNNKNTFINKFFNRKNIVDKNTYINIIKKINVLNGKKTTVLATTLKEECAKDIVNKIAKELKIKDIYYDINNNSNLLNSNKNIVLIEVLEQSKAHELNNVCTLIKDYKLNVLGSVLVDND